MTPSLDAAHHDRSAAVHHGRSGCRRRLTRRLGPVLLAAAILAAACGDDSPQAEPAAVDTAGGVDDGAEPGSPPGADVVDDPDELRAAAVAAALDVRADGCGPRVGLGTGAVFDDRLALTAAHVVAGADEVEVIDTDGRRTDAVVVSFDPDLDLAVLRLDDAVGAPIALRADDAMTGEVGIAVVPRWIGDELELRVADVDVARTVNISTTDIYLDDEVDRPGFEITASVDTGDSGALVVLPGGGAGIVWARSRADDRRAWAIDLPAAVTANPDDRPTWDEPVDVGPCIR